MSNITNHPRSLLFCFGPAVGQTLKSTDSVFSKEIPSLNGPLRQESKESLLFEVKLIEKD